MSWTKERFEHELRKFDPLLRVRLAVDGARWLVERRARQGSLCIAKPFERRGWDAWVRDRDGYVHVLSVPRHLLNHHVFLELRAQDMWAYRGAGWFADHLEAQEQRVEEQKDRQVATEVEAASEEAFDRLAWLDGRRVGMALSDSRHTLDAVGGKR